MIESKTCHNCLFSYFDNGVKEYLCGRRMRGFKVIKLENKACKKFMLASDEERQVCSWLGYSRDLIKLVILIDRDQRIVFLFNELIEELDRTKKAFDEYKEYYQERIDIGKRTKEKFKEKHSAILVRDML